MPMPGGWTMSMAWMRMPGQTWPGAAASFLGMWVVMMVAMMLPSLVPVLWRYRQAVGRTGEARLGRLTALVGVGYFFVWTVFGMAAFPLGVALAAIEMRQPALARAVPVVVGVVVLIAGALQFTAWKARHLACCREAPGRGRTLPTDTGTAWRQGLRLGLHCNGLPATWTPRPAPRGAPRGGDGSRAHAHAGAARHAARDRPGARRPGARAAEAERHHRAARPARHDPGPGPVGHSRPGVGATSDDTADRPRLGRGL
jgi:hypothetical protein